MTMPDINYNESLRIRKGIRVTWYVDATNGNDNNLGTSPAKAFATIDAAITAASAGDRIIISEDSYDEAISIPAGLAGLEVICEEGVILGNTTPGTVVSIAADVHWVGGVITPVGTEIGMAITGATSLIEGVYVQGATTSFDIDAAYVRMKNCISLSHSASGFDISAASAWLDNCHAIGDAASRGFYLSGGSADNCLLTRCSTLGCTAAGYETVAGADNNLFADCAQSSLCAGPTDGGANNTWANHKEDSQISGGNTLQQDLKDIYDTAGYFEQTVPLKMNSSQDLDNTAADADFVADNTLAVDGLISTDDSKVQKIFLIIIGRAVNTYDGTNDLDCSTATHNQWKVNIDGGAYSDLVNGAADGQMLEGDWLCIGEGAIHPFTFMFEVTSQITNIDGNIGVQLENARSAQDGLTVICDIYLKILWKL